MAGALNDVTFFMIVTPRDVVIADYAIRSYTKLIGVGYRLVVYSNYLLPEQKEHYFPRWERQDHVEIRRNPHHDAEIEAMRRRVVPDHLEGPFEYCDPLWDRELPTLPGRYIGTVDADFEILSPSFIPHLLGELDRDPGLIGFSTDYSPTGVHYESFINEEIVLNERNHTWFCLYRREAFELSQVSQAFHRDDLPSGPIRKSSWDSGAYFQKSLRDQGLRFRHLDRRFRGQYIHYGAFSKNTTVTRRNVAIYRRFAIIENALPARLTSRFRRLRQFLLPRLENNRGKWVREASITW